MTVFLALLAILVPASLTLVGYWFKQQQDRRLDSERAAEQARLKAEREKEELLAIAAPARERAATLGHHPLAACAGGVRTA